MIRPAVVLGSTGSIGTQALEAADNLGVEVKAIAARQPGDAFLAQARRYPDARLVVTGGSKTERASFQEALGRAVLFDMDSLVEVASMPGVVVINGIVGAAGLRATIAGLEAGNRVGLANKESLVAGGPVVKGALRDYGGELIPVDSEHSALYQCLLGENPEAVARLILTASGGPFRGRDREFLESVTPEQALDHPTWEMGQRITIDSATLFNKGLEVIEAHYLFDVGYDRIGVVVHPQSVVHSMVEFVDGSVIAQLSPPDMRLPIQYALTYPDRLPGPALRLDLSRVVDLQFIPPDFERFDALRLGLEAARSGGTAGCVLNAANEAAVAGFLAGQVPFAEIVPACRSILEHHDFDAQPTIERLVQLDRWAREEVSRWV